MFDGGIEICAPTDHSGGANCNPRGKMALGAVNLQARVSVAAAGPYTCNEAPFPAGHIGVLIPSLFLAGE